MNLNNLSWEKDRVRVKTAKGIRSSRIESKNMYTDDIDKAKPK